MNYKIHILESASFDLIELKKYITKSFSPKIWQLIYGQIKKAIRNLKTFPLSGGISPETQKLNLAQYRQMIVGKNKIIYEIRQNIIYIHIIVDARKDMMSLLTKRLLRTKEHNEVVFD